MWYDIDFIKLARMLLPPVLRKKRLFALLCVLLSAVVYVYRLFTEYRKRITKRLNMSGQVQYLEKVLNDEFFLDNNEIYITDVERTVLYLYKKNGNGIPVYLHDKPADKPLHVKYKGEGSYTGDFVVNIPSFLNGASYLDTIKSLLDYFKPAGRAYRINIYTYE